MSNKAFEEREFIPVEGNPFGLVYKGAITENVDGAVNIHAIGTPIATSMRWPTSTPRQATTPPAATRQWWWRTPTAA